MLIQSETQREAVHSILSRFTQEELDSRYKPLVVRLNKLLDVRDTVTLYFGDYAGAGIVAYAYLISVGFDVNLQRMEDIIVKKVVD